jgi:hypothetical protein
MKIMRPLTRVLTIALAGVLALAQTAAAFCGFYVATTDSPLINKASRVVLAHDGDTTLVTMASDVVGDPKQFGLVIPVPTVIKREQVKIVKAQIVQHLADYTKPRLVQYYDEDPCHPPPLPVATPMATMAAPMPVPHEARSTVVIEQQYSVEEYNIVVLTATKPGDLVSWLNQHGYRIPPGAEATVGSYLRQGMHFFLAKVDLTRMHDNPTGFLRPIQVTYKSQKFMLPIRLGTVNAVGPQDMIVMALTRTGRLETTNYPTVKVPTGNPIPLFVEARFGEFYDAMFAREVTAHSGATFLEYAWNMGNCDPCSAAPLSNQELRTLGAAWVPEEGWQQQAFVTRLHVRYDRNSFPEDLALHETGDTESFQARYVMRHPFSGAIDCSAGERYRSGLPRRFEQEAQSLQALTGWEPAMIRIKMNETGEARP